MLTLNDEEQERCKTIMGLFGVLSEKFNPQHNEAILFLKYCKIIREQSENAEKCNGHLRLTAYEHEYKENTAD